MRSTQIEVGVGGWKAVKMRAADGGKEQRVRLRSGDAVEERIDNHERG
jgi:hypothetical protein